MNVTSDSLQSHGLYSPWNSPGQNTGVGSLSFLQGIFSTQGPNPGLSHCRADSSAAEPPGSWRKLEWVAHPSSSRSFWLRVQITVPVDSYPTELPGNKICLILSISEFFTFSFLMPVLSSNSLSLYFPCCLILIECCMNFCYKVPWNFIEIIV